ncbi:MAG: hypothetical protein ABIU05_02375 [Nitrospirales bacterium]
MAPKLVLWFYYKGNDLLDVAREQRSPLLMNYLATGFSQELRPLQFKINEALVGHVEAVRASLNPMGRLYALISSEGGLAEELEGTNFNSFAGASPSSPRCYVA